jgi:DNA-binding CsgD family transcriptional regulator
VPHPAFDKAGSERAPPAIGDTISRNIMAHLRTVYELTGSEAEVGQLLLSGAHARQISRLRAVSIETVRSQIKRVYSKANVKSHSEFILNNQPLLPLSSDAATRLAHRSNALTSRKGGSKA